MLLNGPGTSGPTAAGSRTGTAGAVGGDVGILADPTAGGRDLSPYVVDRSWLASTAVTSTATAHL